MRIAILIAVLAAASAVVFVIDRSGSTYEELAIEKQAVITAIGALDPSEHVSVVAYNSVATVETLTREAQRGLR